MIADHITMRKFFLLVLMMNNHLVFGESSNVYDRFFPKTRPGEFKDTLFERILWKKKVSFLIIENIQNGFYVTLLVIPESPYNYKAQSYALHYYFSEFQEAFDKMVWFDNFLKNDGILKVKTNGSLIIEEKILTDISASD